MSERLDAMLYLTTKYNIKTAEIAEKAGVDCEVVKAMFSGRTLDGATEDKIVDAAMSIVFLAIKARSDTKISEIRAVKNPVGPGKKKAAPTQEPKSEPQPEATPVGGKEKGLTDEEVEAEIERLSKSPMVALARRKQRIDYRRRQRLYNLRDLEKKGKALAAAGITMEVLNAMDAVGEEPEGT